MWFGQWTGQAAGQWWGDGTEPAAAAVVVGGNKHKPHIIRPITEPAWMLGNAPLWPRPKDQNDDDLPLLGPDAIVGDAALSLRRRRQKQQQILLLMRARNH